MSSSRFSVRKVYYSGYESYCTCPSPTVTHTVSALDAVSSRFACASTTTVRPGCSSMAALSSRSFSDGLLPGSLSSTGADVDGCGLRIDRALFDLDGVVVGVRASEAGWLLPPPPPLLLPLLLLPPPDDTLRALEVAFDVRDPLRLDGGLGLCGLPPADNVVADSLLRSDVDGLPDDGLFGMHAVITTTEHM